MKYGFLGCGNMGGAIATALSKSTKNILLSSRTQETAKQLAQALGCQAASSNEEIICACDVIFLAVKPQMMASVLDPLTALLLEKKPVLVSMAAGLKVDRIVALAGGDLPVVRIMPNTPVSIGKGMTTYCCNSLVEESILTTLLADLSPAGRFDPIDEQLMDAATVAAGCAPAYTYMFIEAMAAGAEACGLSRDKAITYAAAAVAGAAQLLLETGEDPGRLKDAVCSPGGSTIAGVKVLENSDFRSKVMETIAAAYQRNIELGK